MKQLVKGIVFAAAALMLMQAPQAQAKVKVKKVKAYTLDKEIITL